MSSDDDEKNVSTGWRTFYYNNTKMKPSGTYGVPGAY